MIRHLHPTLFFLLIGLFLQYCAARPDYPDEPVIEFVSLSKTAMKQSALGPDSVQVSFNFTDGDGDLGDDTGEPDIFIVDSRDGFSKPSYRIPRIEQQGAGNGISGVITLVLPTTCCIYVNANNDTTACQYVPVPLDTLTYLISIRDRAGHESNRIETPPIGLICK